MTTSNTTHDEAMTKTPDASSTKHQRISAAALVTPDADLSPAGVAATAPDEAMLMVPTADDDKYEDDKTVTPAKPQRITYDHHQENDDGNHSPTLVKFKGTDGADDPINWDESNSQFKDLPPAVAWNAHHIVKVDNNPTGLPMLIAGLVVDTLMSHEKMFEEGSKDEHSFNDPMNEATSNRMSKIGRLAQCDNSNLKQMKSHLARICRSPEVNAQVLFMRDYERECLVMEEIDECSGFRERIVTITTLFHIARANNSVSVLRCMFQKKEVFDADIHFLLTLNKAYDDYGKTKDFEKLLNTLAPTPTQYDAMNRFWCLKAMNFEVLRHSLLAM